MKITIKSVRKTEDPIQYDVTASTVLDNGVVQFTESATYLGCIDDDLRTCRKYAKQLLISKLPEWAK